MSMSGRGEEKAGQSFDAFGFMARFAPLIFLIVLHGPVCSA